MTALHSIARAAATAAMYIVMGDGSRCPSQGTATLLRLARWEASLNYKRAGRLLTFSGWGSSH